MANEGRGAFLGYHLFIALLDIVFFGLAWMGGLDLDLIRSPAWLYLSSLAWVRGWLL
jgi:hypothetical protein